MHDFCICADNAVEGKVSTALLKHSGMGSGTLPLKRFLTLGMFICVSSLQNR